MVKVYSLFIFSIAWVSGGVIDCSSDFKCIANRKDPNMGYSIELTLSQGDADEYQLDLYDLMTEKVVSSKKEYFTKGTSKVVFEKVKPSAYTVLFSSSKCARKVIKGKGIVLE